MRCRKRTMSPAKIGDAKDRECKPISDGWLAIFGIDNAIISTHLRKRPTSIHAKGSFSRSAAPKRTVANVPVPAFQIYGRQGHPNGRFWDRDFEAQAT